MWQRLAESDKLWWSLYGLFVLIIVLLSVAKWRGLMALKVAGVVFAIALGVLVWLKYRKKR